MLSMSFARIGKPGAALEPMNGKTRRGMTMKEHQLRLSDRAPKNTVLYSLRDFRLWAKKFLVASKPGLDPIAAANLVRLASFYLERGHHVQPCGASLIVTDQWAKNSYLVDTTGGVRPPKRRRRTKPAATPAPVGLLDPDED